MNSIPSTQKRAILYSVSLTVAAGLDYHKSTIKLESQLTNSQIIFLTSRMGKRGGKRVSMSGSSFERLVKLIDSSLEAVEAEAVEISVHRNEQIPRTYLEPIHSLNGIIMSLKL